MSFFGLLRRPKKKASSKSTDPDLVAFDLVYQLTYLSAVAGAGIPRAQIFELASALPCGTSGYFREVDRISKNMNYQYAESCRIVGGIGEGPDGQELAAAALQRHVHR